MGERLTITQNELLEALRESIEPVADDALTVVEIAAELGLNRHAALRKVVKLVEEGRAECVTVVRMDRTGRRIQTAGYRMLPAA